MAKVKEKPGISKLIVGGFKSIAKRTEIEVRPLTVFCGANSSGKSSAMQPLLLMKQTLESPYDPGPLRLDGPNVRFTSSSQFLCASNKQASDFSIEFGVALDNVSYFASTFSCAPNKSIDLESMVIATDKVQPVKFIKGSSHKDLATLLKNTQPQTLQIDSKYTISLERSYFFFELQLGLASQDEFYTFPHFYFRTIGQASHDILNVIHIPGLRGNPARAYKLTATGPRFPGRFEEYTASILHEWANSKDSRLKSIGNQLAELGLTWKVATKKTDDTQVEVQVGRLLKPTSGGGKDLVNIADVGFGVSQTLPVLVALLTAEPNQLVYIEQPEIHLHPRAQFALASCLVDAAKRGVRVVVETHSSQLLLGLQTAIAQDMISPKHVLFHWFERDPMSGESKISAVEPDSAGRFGDWPVDFDEAIMEAQTKYLDVAEAKVIES